MIHELTDELNALLNQVRGNRRSIDIRKAMQICLQEEQTSGGADEYLLKGVCTIERFLCSGEWGSAEYEINRLLFLVENYERQQVDKQD